MRKTDDAPITARPPGFPRTKDAALRELACLIAEELDALREKVDNPIKLVHAIGELKSQVVSLEAMIDRWQDSERNGHKETQNMIGRLFSRLDASDQDLEQFKRSMREQISALKKEANGHAST